VAASGNIDLVQLLLDQNSDVSLFHWDWECTALMAAIFKNVKYLYETSWMDKDCLMAPHQVLIVHLLLEQMTLTDKTLIDYQDMLEGILHFT